MNLQGVSLVAVYVCIGVLHILLAATLAVMAEERDYRKAHKEKTMTSVQYTHEIPMGHRLQHHAGRCRFLHGHNYIVQVAYVGSIDPQTGMVVDFSDLKKAVRTVLDRYDHAFVLERTDPSRDSVAPFSTLITTENPPTAENLGHLWRTEIAVELNVPIKALKLRVLETRDCAVDL